MDSNRLNREVKNVQIPVSGCKFHMAREGVGLWPIWQGMGLSFSLLVIMAVANGISTLAFNETISSFVDRKMPGA